MQCGLPYAFWKYQGRTITQKILTKLISHKQQLQHHCWKADRWVNPEVKCLYLIHRTISIFTCPKWDVCRTSVVAWLFLSTAYVTIENSLGGCSQVKKQGEDCITFPLPAIRSFIQVSSLLPTVCFLSAMGWGENIFNLLGRKVAYR